MPARPHRTVDRVTGILETVSLSPRGVTLAELATALGAAKSRSGAHQRASRPRLPHRGGAPLPPRTGPVHPRRAREQAGRAVARSPVRGRAGQGPRLHRPRRGARRGRHRLHRPRRRGVTQPDVRRAHPRPPPPSTRAPPARPCSPTSPTTRCTASSTSPAPTRPSESASSSPSSPRSAPADSPSTAEPRSRDAFVVATPLLAPDGGLIAAISAAVDDAEADRLDDMPVAPVTHPTRAFAPSRHRRASRLTAYGSRFPPPGLPCLAAEAPSGGPCDQLRAAEWIAGAAGAPAAGLSRRH